MVSQKKVLCNLSVRFVIFFMDTELPVTFAGYRAPVFSKHSGHSAFFQIFAS